MPGSSGAPGFEDWSHLTGWSWEIEQGQNAGQAGLTKPIDSASPKLLMTLINAQIIPEDTEPTTLGAEGDFTMQMSKPFDLRTEDNDLDFHPDSDDPDDDNDSLSDTLEIEAGLNPLGADAHHDGQSNRTEAIAGTGVRDGTFRWQISKLEGANGATRLHWIARPGRTYRIFSTTNLLAPNWTEYTAGPIPTGNHEIVSIEIPSMTQSQLFKVSVDAP
ncbi:hypothetical protein V2O64_05920 [Verrucomicrobiaceae bacterium 227]